MKLKLCLPEFFIVIFLVLISLCKLSQSWPTLEEPKFSVNKLIKEWRAKFPLKDELIPKITELFKSKQDHSLKWIHQVLKEESNNIQFGIKDAHLRPRNDPDIHRNLTQLITSHGYPVMKYTVQTKDGFLLDLHRIPHGIKNTGNRNGTRPAIFLQHGLLSSACDWLLNLPHDSLGFILADSGYDVWLGNSRGNTYSRRHVTLKPSDNRFWDWSFDEMAKFDTPAFIDFILKTTGQPSLYYVGHSQGTMTAFALFASQPEYQKKVRLFVGLAPIISLNYIESPIKYLSVVPDKDIYAVFGRKDFLPNNAMIKFFADTFCEGKPTRWLCTNLLFILCGTDTTYLNKTRLPVYLNHTPAGASVKDMIHFSQMIREKRFSMYDYGSDSENMKRYNQTLPPGYDATKVKVPSLLFTAPKDFLADPKDVEILTSTLPNIVGRIDIPKWNHLDFVWGENANSVCYDKIVEWLPKF